MGKSSHEAKRQAGLMCPACKNPVDAIITGRHKSLGIYVPTWGPGPCHNPDCPEHVEVPEHARTEDHS